MIPMKQLILPSFIYTSYRIIISLNNNKQGITKYEKKIENIIVKRKIDVILASITKALQRLITIYIRIYSDSTRVYTDTRMNKNSLKSLIVKALLLNVLLIYIYQIWLKVGIHV